MGMRLNGVMLVSMPERSTLLILVTVAAMPCIACSSLAPPKTEITEAIHHHVEHVTIGATAIDMHVAEQPGVRPGTPLVIFASGDGGWFGSAIGMFDAVAAAGYPVAGVSARGLLRALRTDGRQISSAHVREAYEHIISAARAALRIRDDRPTIIAGWSRGASLAVIVGAGLPEATVAGVVAIGLSADEDLNVDLDSDNESGKSTPARPERLDTYALSTRIAGPVAIIQSTGDGYLAAEQARIRFGADSPARRFYEVSARNHRFSGGEPAFRRVLNDALRWMSADQGTYP